MTLRACSGSESFHPTDRGSGNPPIKPDADYSTGHRFLHELTKKLGIEKFRMLGISGGAPYALAAAWAMPDQVEAIAVVSGAPPIFELTDHSGLLSAVPLDARAFIEQDRNFCVNSFARHAPSHRCGFRSA